MDKTSSNEERISEPITKDAVLKFIQGSSSNPDRRTIARAFGIKGSARIELKRILKELSADGLIADAKRATKPSALSSVAVIVVTGQDRDGDLLAAPLHWNEASDGPAPGIVLDLTRRYDGPAIGVGDHVLARLRPAEDQAGGTPAYLASPIKRLPRQKQSQLGILRKTRHGYIVESIDKKDINEWPIAVEDAKGASDGELVRFTLAKSSSSGRTVATIAERIGNPRAEKAVSLIAIHNHGLRHHFTEAVMREIAHLPELSARHGEDLTKIPLLTIDPEDAKDHDDAVWAGPDDSADNPGGFVVVVAIADVSFYVRPGSAIDAEAQLRGNSVYFPDRVVPMLPEKLSNDLCSLREKELRPCLAVRMTFDANGKKRGHRFTRGLMRSAAKLSYQQAQRAIDGHRDAKTEALLKPVLKPLWAAYHVLKEAREKRGPLEIDLPERKILLNEQGLVHKIVVPERLEAHRLIEEFMIQANVAAAETLEAKKSPLIYRVHDGPSSEKVVALSEFLATLGINAPKTGFKRPSQFNQVLRKVAGGEHSDLLNELILRSQAQAEYSSANIGHFGLNLRRYAHFTSPIRRYADLIVHRALVSACELGEGGLSAAERDRLAAVAEQISQAERKAISAERETVDRLIALHMAERIGEEFHGRISGVTRSGLFVKLKETGADGFIPAATLGRDYYRHVEAAHALVNERTGDSYRVGDNVDVKLIECVPSAGALRFEMVSDGKYRPELSKAVRKRGGRSSLRGLRGSGGRGKSSRKVKR